MKRILFTLAGVVAGLVGLGFVMPAVALWRQEGALAGANVALLLFGVVLALGGGTLVATAFRNARP
jgi:hypothetical protein